MPTLEQLKEAVAIAEQIEKLQAEFTSLVGGGSMESLLSAVATPVVAIKSGKRTMSAEARERIAAVQRTRWAKNQRQISQSCVRC